MSLYALLKYADDDDSLKACCELKIILGTQCLGKPWRWCGLVINASLLLFDSTKTAVEGSCSSTRNGMAQYSNISVYSVYIGRY